METLFIYFIKSSGLIVMFFLAYYFLLRKETFFNSNRWFLLAGLITSVVLPLVVFKKIVWVEPTPTTFEWSNIPVTTTTVENEGFEINWYLVFVLVYSIGILGFLSKFAFDFYCLAKVLKGKTVQHQAHFKFIDVSENIAPFSYFNSIVYNSSLYSATELENILEHEKVHSEQNHTADVLISRLFCVIFWFHPLMWLYKKAIVQNLEFIADSEASKNISDKKAYQLTLLKITTQENCVAITNHFYQSLIKKRIVMLNKNQSKKWNSWKYATVIPALIAFMFLFQIEVVAQVNPEKKPVNNNIIQADTLKLGDNIIIQADTLKLVDTKKSNQKANINNVEVIGYGSSNKNEQIKVVAYGTSNRNEGIKTEKPIIIVDGSQTASSYKIEDIPTDQIASINVLKGKSAEEKYGESGKNGVIEIITKEQNTKNENGSQQIKVVGYGNNQNKVGNGLNISGFSTLDGTKPLIVVDGKTKDLNFNIEDIPKEQIKQIVVLKGKSSEDKYGEKGKNGVIEIITNKNKK